ncbi:MAG TPA: 2-succinylbenzoate-CoA ligase [Psychromonas hadalis]|nr:2-succinylbenzoate-CoA ligase [Psychromonas hadalis]
MEIVDIRYCPVRKQAIEIPDKMAIKTDSEAITFAQLDDRVSATCVHFLEKGLTPNSRLICILKNAIGLVILQLACIRFGVVFCPINPRFSNAETAQRVKKLDTPFIFSGEADDLFVGRGLSRKSKLKQILIPQNQVCSLIFTSGSSGNPKGVMHCFSQHFYSALGAQSVIPLAIGDRNLLSLPQFHISGYATVIRTLLAGATLVLSEETISLELIKKEGITHLSLVSTQLYKLLKSPDFQQSELAIKHLLLGGSAFDTSLLNQTQARGFTYHLSYGSTEMASQIATSTNSQEMGVLPYRLVRISDNEILLKGKTCFVGYFNQANQHQEWFKSKDLGALQNNVLTVQGRKDRQFICGGENIQPEEIEKALLTFSEINKAVVIAVDDEKYGQIPVAFLDCAMSAALKIKIDASLSYFKRPSRYLILPPQTGLKVSLKTLTFLVKENSELN